MDTWSCGWSWSKIKASNADRRWSSNPCEALLPPWTSNTTITREWSLLRITTLPSWKLRAPLSWASPTLSGPQEVSASSCSFGTEDWPRSAGPRDLQGRPWARNFQRIGNMQNPRRSPPWNLKNIRLKKKKKKRRWFDNIECCHLRTFSFNLALVVLLYFRSGSPGWPGWTRSLWRTTL